MPQKKVVIPAHRENRENSRKVERVSNNKPRYGVRIKKTEERVKKIVWSEPVCEKCGQVIKDITLALSDKRTGNPVHFDCVLSLLKNSEELKENEELLYIGNGNFAIVWFEDPKIRKNFKIVKLLEWEEDGEKREWRREIASLASSV